MKLDIFRRIASRAREDAESFQAGAHVDDWASFAWEMAPTDLQMYPGAYALYRETFRKAVGYVPRPRGVSEFVGEEGERRAFTELEMESVREVDTKFGVSRLHSFRDAEDNVLVWWASNEKLEVGVTYDVRATVKAHSTFRGVRQTMLSRCKVEASRRRSRTCPCSGAVLCALHARQAEENASDADLF